MSTDAHLCTHCGEPHTQQLAHKEQMDKTRLTMLKAAAQWVVDHNQNDFKKKDIGLDKLALSAYGNFGRLRYHGLITPIRDARGIKIKGRWLITRNGWAFLRGERSIHKYVLVRNNEIVSRSDDMISVQDVYYGSEAMQTSFEYFDEAGNAVGYKPVLVPMGFTEQEQLL